MLAILAFAGTGLGQPAILAQPGNCTSPVGTNFCQLATPNPCAEVPLRCFDYFRWFSNVIDCLNIPGSTVASASTGLIDNAPWTGCQGGAVPGSSCEMALASCGTISTYAGANCQVATFCGTVTMEACLGQSPVDCPSPP